jgi:phytoene synthase
MTDQLAESYQACRRIARQAASNFTFSFRLLPADKRRGMDALYAFLRISDDIADEEAELSVKRQRLSEWRNQLRLALAGDCQHEILPALADVVRRFRIPPKYLEEALDGVEMDLVDRNYATFDELAEYCYRVASVVGLACIHLWGFTSSAALEPARQCGLAMQLTNILRDVDEDLQRGRVYLPSEDLARFGYSRQELLQRVDDDRFRSLMQFEIGRAETLFDQARRLDQWLLPEGRRVYRAMFTSYRALLDEIKRREGHVFGQRIRLSRARKLQLLVTSWLG